MTKTNPSHRLPTSSRLTRDGLIFWGFRLIIVSHVKDCPA